MNPKISLVIQAICIILTIIIMSFIVKYSIGFFFAGLMVIGMFGLMMYNTSCKIKGYNAYLAGVSFNENPGIRGWNEYYEWNIGWKLAKLHETGDDNVT